MRQCTSLADMLHKPTATSATILAGSGHLSGHSAPFPKRDGVCVRRETRSDADMGSLTTSFRILSCCIRCQMGDVG